MQNNQILDALIKYIS